MVKFCDRCLNIMEISLTNEQGAYDITKAYYMCDTCSMLEPIVEGTLILEKLASSDEHFMQKKKITINALSKTLFHTKTYICKNKRCETHKNAEKDAVYYRVENKLELWYTCNICNTSWIAHS